MQIKLENKIQVNIDGRYVFLSPKEFCRLQEDVTKFYNDNFWSLEEAKRE